MAQIITMAAVFLDLDRPQIIGIQSAFILGIQAGLLAFIPTVGAILGGLIVVLASLASGWVAAASAFVLFMGVHSLESYVLTPIIQRHALDIPRRRCLRSRSCSASCSASGAWRWRCR